MRTAAALILVLLSARIGAAAAITINGELTRDQSRTLYRAAGDWLEHIADPVSIAVDVSFDPPSGGGLAEARRVHWCDDIFYPRGKASAKLFTVGLDATCGRSDGLILFDLGLFADGFDFRSIARHEIGHILGIRGHATSGLMAASIPPNTIRPIDAESLSMLADAGWTIRTVPEPGAAAWLCLIMLLAADRCRRLSPKIATAAPAAA